MCIALRNKNIEIDDNALFHQWTILKKVVDEEMKRDFEGWSRKLCHERWCSVLNHNKFKEQFSELLTLCQYLFSIPGHNGNVERVFSLMNAQWSNERNKLDVSTIEALLQCKFNFDGSCKEFHSYILKDKILLKEASSSAKYY